MPLPHQNQLLFAEVDFSVFVWNFCSKAKSGSRVPLSDLVPKSKSRSWIWLFILLPIWKAKSFFHYLFWTFAPKTKSGTVGVELSFWNINGRAKSTSHFLLWNRCSKWKTPQFHYSTSCPNWNLDSPPPPKKKKNGDPTTGIHLRMSGRCWWVCLWGEGSSSINYCIE